jgi:hypothetical protein
MKTRALFVAGSGLVALVGIAKADDHLFQAVHVGGLTTSSQPFQENGSGKFPDEFAPGQGSPFTSFGDDFQTPASAVALEKPNVNITPRDPREPHGPK